MASEIESVLERIKASMDGVTKLRDAADKELSYKREELKKLTADVAKARAAHAGMISELESKKIAADRASEENARRIKLNNDQVNEIERIKRDLEAREKAVAQREKQGEEGMAKVSSMAVAAQRRFDEVERKEAEIAKRYAKMKEAVG